MKPPTRLYNKGPKLNLSSIQVKIECATTKESLDGINFISLRRLIKRGRENCRTKLDWTKNRIL